MVHDVQPYLDDVRDHYPVSIDSPPERRLRKNGLPQDQVWPFGGMSDQLRPVRRTRPGQLVDIDIRRHATDVPDIQFIGGGKKPQTSVFRMSAQ